MVPPVPAAKRLHDVFHLTEEQWLRIWNFQGGKCPICGKVFEKPQDAKTDHDHKTGLVRGIPCFRCNALIREYLTIDLAKKLLAYLLDPPASKALGGPHYGLPGRVGTKKQRALVRKAQKAKNHVPIQSPLREQ